MAVRKTSDPKSTSSSITSSVTKKVAKHSKKFERTQTGCLQCRQKKKKCDGRRPVCVSCAKKGIKCEFPANIRFFNFKPTERHDHTHSHFSVSSAATKSSTKQDSDSTQSAKAESIIRTSSSTSLATQAKHFEFQNETIAEDQRQDSFKPESLRRSSSIDSFTLQSIEQSRTLSLMTILTTSSFDSVHIDEDEYIFDPILKEQQDSPSVTSDVMVSQQSIDKTLQTKEAIYKKNDEEMEEALNLVNGGESISKILNTITIELITKSIHNLKYINFEEKLNNYYNHQSSCTMESFDKHHDQTDSILKKDVFLNNHGASYALTVHNFDPIFEF